ncbi:MAG: pyridoxal phosphate-dependent decarboxylase family protein, partial [Gemmatimonadaceae bacterium]
MNPSDFRAHAKAVVDWVANYRATIAERPVMAQTAPGVIRAQLPVSPPEQGEPFGAMLRDFDTIIAPGITHWQSPNFYAFFPGAGSLAGVLGDYLSSGIAAVGLSWQACPALTELEEVVTDWMRQMVGLSNAWSGVIQDTASTSTLVALLCARERSTDYSLARGGLQATDRPLVVYVSAHAHSSVDKAALLAGFGRDNVRLVPHDDAYAMRADALRDLIVQD